MCATPSRRRALSAALLAMTLAVAWIVSPPRLDAPFDESYQGFNEGNYSQIGRNYLRYGFWNLLWAPCVEGGSLVAKPGLYIHHPPLTGVRLAAAFALFGESERVVHAIELFEKLGVVALCFLLARRALGGSAWLGALAGILVAGSPVCARFGAMVDPLGSGLLLPLLLAVWCTARWSASGRTRDLALAQVFLVVAYATDLSAFAAPILLAAWVLWTRGRAARGAAAAFLGVAFVAGIAAIGWLVAVQARFGDEDDPISAFLHRFAVQETFVDDALRPVESRAFWRRVLEHHVDAFGGVYLVIAAVAGATLALDAFRGRRERPERALLLVPLSFGVLFVALMPQGAYVHAYWPLTLAPGLALATAALAERASRGGTGRRVAVGIAAAALAAGVCIAGGRSARLDWEARARASRTLRDAGLFVHAHTRPEQPVIATLRSLPPFTWYTDRKILYGIRDVGAWIDVARTQPESTKRIHAIVVERELAARASDPIRAIGLAGPRAFGALDVWLSPAPESASSR